MPTTWSTTDKTAAGSLSGGNLIFTTGTNSAVRTPDRVITGKYYWEYTGTTWGGSQTVMGVASAAATLSTVAGSPFYAATVQRLNGAIFLNGAAAPGSPQLGTRATGDIIGVALDCDSKQIWFRVCPAGNWNGNAGYAPGGTGGVSLTAINPDNRLLPLYGLVGGTVAGDVVTANFGGSAFSGALPSGYTSGFPSPSVPTLYAVATQVASEQWIMPNANAQASAVLLEMWAPGGTTTPRAVATLVALEQWASSGLAVTQQQARAWILA